MDTLGIDMDINRETGSEYIVSHDSTRGQQVRTSNTRYCCYKPWYLPAECQRLHLN